MTRQQCGEKHYQLQENTYTHCRELADNLNVFPCRFDKPRHTHTHLTHSYSHTLYTTFNTPTTFNQNLDRQDAAG